MNYQNAKLLMLMDIGMTRLAWNNPKQFITKQGDTHLLTSYGGPPVEVQLASEDLKATDWEVTRQQTT